MKDAKAPGPFRHLSPSIVPKRNYLAVDMSVSLADSKRKSHIFKCLYAQETIECE